MGLLKDLQQLVALAEAVPSGEAMDSWRPQTADELYADFLAAARAHARMRQPTINFHWQHHQSSDPAEWERYRAVREEVVTRLQIEGLKTAKGYPDEMPPPVFHEWRGQGEWHQSITHHYIKASWF